MECRAGCAACCIAPSMASPLPPDPRTGGDGLPGGKPAGLPCPRLDSELRCALFGRPERPAVCGSLRPSPSMCGNSREEALAGLEELERRTRPD